MKKSRIHALLLMLAALIWGIAFVAQREGGSALGAYSFNCLRFWIGAAALSPVIAVLDRKKPSPNRPVTRQGRRRLLRIGLICGLFLCLATNLQQVALTMDVSAGKAGFLTACYILMVPILGLALGRRCGWNVWLAVAVALGGLYLLCINGSFRLKVEDLLLLLCALLFSFQILAVDRFAPEVDGVRLSRIQFLVSASLTLPLMIAVDVVPMGLRAWLQALFSRQTMIPLLYTGFLSSGAGYTLQIVGQQDVNPTVASLLMSLESVFAVLAGWAILHERMSLRELGGCALVFAAIVLAQIEFGKSSAKEG